MSVTQTKEEILDYKAIQLKVGVEVHQQLSTGTKLFCACPPFAGDDSEIVKGNAAEFERILRPAPSELGEVDEAAQFESRREIKVKYLASSTASCLVEADEEPPRPISSDAIDTALIFALTLHSRVIDEIHVMRKIVVDGSNTSGFQRTTVVALGGKLNYGEGKSVEVQTISLEEDAARAVKEVDGRETSVERTYALDRLGTPLVEVALAPIEGDPGDAEAAASTLGRLMRSTRRIARGLGTIRQDLNISVLNGRVIEVKGVQRLDQIRKVVIFEAARQKFFYDLAVEIRQKAGDKLEINQSDATDVFKYTKSIVLRKALSSDSPSVICLKIRNFKGFIGRENVFHSRLGKELGGIARTYGLGGVFHSDELPNYGITIEEIARLREKLDIRDDDAFVIVAGPTDKVEKAAVALRNRLQFSTIGVPAETRAASLDGETTFLRPRPGAARMYPETDIPLIQVSEQHIEDLKKEIPEPWEKQVRSFSNKYDLPQQLAEPLFDSDRKDLFECTLEKTTLPSRYVASILVDMLSSLSREGVPIDSLKDEDLLLVFEALNSGKFAKEALSSVLSQLASNPGLSLDQTLAKAGLSVISEVELEKIVDEVIAQNANLLEAKGPGGAQKTLMGLVMQRVRGRADGKLVNETLSKRLSALADKGKS